MATSMKISQALVAVGGRARRLRVGGVRVPISKAFLPVCGRPLLHWSLLALFQSGIRRLVICWDRPEQRDEAQRVIAELALPWDGLELVRDDGLGVHRLPFSALPYLDENFLFECGHSVMTPEHYRNLMAAKQPGTVVFSAYRPHKRNPRLPVYLLDEERVEFARVPRVPPSAFATPFVVDRDYAERLPELDFNIVRVVRHYCGDEPASATHRASPRARWVHSGLPPEFDIMEEYQQCLAVYRNQVKKLGGRPDAGRRSVARRAEPRTPVGISGRGPAAGYARSTAHH